MVPPKGVYLPFGSYIRFDLPNLLAPNNKSQICYCVQISLQSVHYHLFCCRRLNFITDCCSWLTAVFLTIWHLWGYHLFCWEWYNTVGVTSSQPPLATQITEKNRSFFYWSRTRDAECWALVSWVILFSAMDRRCSSIMTVWVRVLTWPTNWATEERSSSTLSPSGLKLLVWNIAWTDYNLWLQRDRPGFSYPTGRPVLSPRHQPVLPRWSNHWTPGYPFLANLGGHQMACLNIYIPPCTCCPAGFQPDLAPILDADYGADVLVMGNFNAHHPAWFSVSRDDRALARGVNIAEAIDSSPLCLLNEDSPTRLPPNGTPRPRPLP